MANYRCSKCKKVKADDHFHQRPPNRPGGRPVSYHCQECRTDRDRRLEVFVRELKKYGEVCKTCARPKKLKMGNECETCLRERGLKVCIKCNQLGLVLLDFMGVKGLCIPCWEKMEPKVEQARKKAEFKLLPVADQKLSLAIKKYGLMLEDYKKMMHNQGGVCKICKTHPEKRRLAVDHCHKTGRVRGLLCSSCNLTLGVMKDDPALLRAAAEYLTHHGDGTETSHQN